MVNFFTAAVFVLPFVAACVSAHGSRNEEESNTPYHHVPSKRLSMSTKVGRQNPLDWEPDNINCSTECSGLENAMSTCRSSSCYCTDAVAVYYRECMVCSLNLQNDPSVLSGAQQSMVDYEVNCESDGYPVASLSVVVAAPTDQPSAASPAWTPSYTLPGTSTVILPGAVHTGPPTPPPGVTMVSSFWTSGGTFYFTAGWSTISEAMGSSTTDVAILSIPTSAASLGSSDSASLPDAAVTTPQSGSTLITFSSPAATPSVSDTTVVLNNHTNGSDRLDVTVSCLLGALLMLFVVSMDVL